jgi:SAM-dependent methyltransferase
MTRNRTLFITFTLTLVISSLALLPAASAQQQQQFVPQLGQAGKDVIWIPTPEETITAMLDMAKVTPNDYVIDLGSGDGRIVIAAAKRGARALGIEYNLDMVDLSKSNAQKEGVAAKASFEHGDIFERDFSQATVLTMYLLPNLNMKLRPKILEMKPGTRVVTNSFNMDDWDPDQTTTAGDRTVYFWIVPAQVAGAWAWTATSGGAELTVKQNFQKIEGSLKISGKELPLKNAKLEGAHISFSAGDSTPQQFEGTVSGNSIQGMIKAGNGPATKWLATRR